MQRRENEMAGERRLHGVLGGLLIADLADHDDVRVLAQDRAERGREGDADLRLHRGLIDLLMHHFDRIFDRRDVDLGARQRLQRRIERHGLSRTGRAGDQNDSVRPLDPLIEGLQFIFVESEAGNRSQHHVGIEDAHDDFFAEGNRQSRDAQLDLFAVMLGLDAAVLRPALLGDIHATHRLEA